MSFADIVQTAQSIVSEYHEDSGVLCTVRGLTWNATKNLFEPPYTVKAINVPVTIQSIAAIRDPDAPATARSLNIGLEEYRRLTLPVGIVAVAMEDTVVRQPIVSNSDTYLVVQPIAPDESMPLEIHLHCRKV